MPHGRTYTVHALIALLTSVLVYSALTIANTLPLASSFLANSPSFGEALRAVTQLWVGSLLDLSAPDALYTLAFSILMGINVALAVYYFNTRARMALHASATGILGAAVSLLGLGCASCGSLVAAALFSGMGGISTVWLSDTYIKAAGLMLLTLSIALMLRAIRRPNVC